MYKWLEGAALMRTVLVVDDDEAIRRIIRLVLEGEGYPIEEAQNGEEALRAMCASEDAMGVTLDLMMPHLGAGKCWRRWVPTRSSRRTP
jgi:CheY-like chemotaxis protein